MIGCRPLARAIKFFGGREVANAMKTKHVAPIKPSERGDISEQTDVFTPEKRSEVMSRVRSRGNLRTELALIKIFRNLRIIGWRRNQPVFGKPDFVFWKERTAVFVDGCFWHCCPMHATWPKNNAAFWEEKFAKNRVRDRLVTRTLKKRNWRVLRIWEHELKRSNRAKLDTRLLKAFRPSAD